MYDNLPKSAMNNLFINKELIYSFAKYSSNMIDYLNYNNNSNIKDTIKFKSDTIKFQSDTI